MEDLKQFLEEGSGFLGIELGSTRIKAVIIDDGFRVAASGSHTWENRLVDGIWTYTMEDIHEGLRAAYADLLKNVSASCGAVIRRYRAIGISAMMHGYLPFDENGALLSMFRTWRNTSAHAAAEKMTALLGHNIPDRWSSAHLYDAVLRDEPHLKELRFMTTLAGYIHFRLTGEKVIGIGDASGIFPIDGKTGDYREDLLAVFDDEIADKGYPWKTRELFPRVLKAGENAGVLSEEGAFFLDASGSLQSGIPLCPPEGDAATGMIATGSVRRRSGNLSAGTSGFLMAVLDEEIRTLHREIEQINTPDGSPVAMVHANNCTTDLSAWVSLFGEFAEDIGLSLKSDELYGLLFRKALCGDADAGGIFSYNFHAGEFLVDMERGCPLLVRRPDASFDLAHFMRAQLNGTIAVLRLGVDRLREEGVRLDSLTAHGGLFKTPGAAQRIVAGALRTPVRVMETAGEGGAFGIAVLAAYLVRENPAENLPDYLDRCIFSHARVTVAEPLEEDAAGYDRFMEGYKAALAAEKAAAEVL